MRSVSLRPRASRAVLTATLSLATLAQVHCGATQTRGSAPSRQPACDLLGACAFVRDVPLEDPFLYGLAVDAAARLHVLTRPSQDHLAARVLVLGDGGFAPVSPAAFHYGFFARGSGASVQVFGPEGHAGPWRLFALHGGRWTTQALPPDLGLPLDAATSARGGVTLLHGTADAPPEGGGLRATQLAPDGSWSPLVTSARGARPGALALDDGGRPWLAWWEPREPRPDVPPHDPARALVCAAPGAAPRTLVVEAPPSRDTQDRVELLAPPARHRDAFVSFVADGTLQVARIAASGAVTRTPIAPAFEWRERDCNMGQSVRSAGECTARPPCRIEGRSVRSDHRLVRTSDGVAWLAYLLLVSDGRLPWEFHDVPRRGARGAAARASARTPPLPTPTCRYQGEARQHLELVVARLGERVETRVRRTLETGSGMSQTVSGLHATAHGAWIYLGHSGVQGSRVLVIDTGRL